MAASRRGAAAAASHDCDYGAFGLTVRSRTTRSALFVGVVVHHRIVKTDRKQHGLFRFPHVPFFKGLLYLFIDSIALD
jgi:hypothetical protein